MARSARGWFCGLALRRRPRIRWAVSQLRSKRRRNAEFLQKLNRLMLVLVVLALAAGVFLVFLPQCRRLDELSARLAEEKAKLAAQELLRDRRLREVDLLENDPGYVETIARDKIDVMREGEVVIRLDPADLEDPAVRALPAQGH